MSIPRRGSLLNVVNTLRQKTKDKSPDGGKNKIPEHPPKTKGAAADARAKAAPVTDLNTPIAGVLKRRVEGRKEIEERRGLYGDPPMLKEGDVFYRNVRTFPAVAEPSEEVAISLFRVDLAPSPGDRARKKQTPDSREDGRKTNRDMGREESMTPPTDELTR